LADRWWYERLDALPTKNRHGLVVMVAVSGVASDVGVSCDPLGDEVGYLVTLGCAGKLLEQFGPDLDAVDIRLEWVRSEPARREPCRDRRTRPTRAK
jgi:hypothetical protein